jgi:excisionase family DNA binding protein
MTRLLLSIPEAADTLAMSRASLYRLIGRGEIAVIKIGRMTRLETAELERYIHRLRQESGGDQSSVDDTRERIVVVPISSRKGSRRDRLQRAMPATPRAPGLTIAHLK